jgi:transposase
MVAAVRQGHSLRRVAREFGVSLRTVQGWLQRAQDQRLDRVDWSDQPRGGRRASYATTLATEELIVRLRKELKETSALGEYGAVAIQRALQQRRRRRS